MLKRSEHLVLVLLGVLIGRLIVANATLILINRSPQTEIQGRVHSTLWRATLPSSPATATPTRA